MSHSLFCYLYDKSLGAMIKDLRKKKFIVYERVLNCKKYYGFTMKDLYGRAGGNGSGYKGCPIFWDAIQKYGWENVRSRVIFENLNEKQAKMLETYMIITEDTTNPEYGYNSTRGEGFIVDAKLMEELLKTGDIKLLEDLDDEVKIKNSHKLVKDFVEGIIRDNVEGKKRIRERMEKWGIVESSLSHYLHASSDRGGLHRYNPKFYELWTKPEKLCEGDFEPLF